MIPNCVGCGRFTTFTFVRVYSALPWKGAYRDDFYCVRCAEKAGI